MRNPERIDRIIEELRATWKDSPDMRLCQLVFSITRNYAGDLFYIEDDLFEAMGGRRENMSDSFQERVRPWLIQAFGYGFFDDWQERNHRFLEEALELVQACGCTQDEAHQLVDYVFNRPAGEPIQEAGGVMTTLAALCLLQRLDMHAAGEIELARIWEKIDDIRAKQAM